MNQIMNDLAQSSENNDTAGFIGMSSFPSLPFTIFSRRPQDVHGQNEPTYELPWAKLQKGFIPYLPLTPSLYQCSLDLKLSTILSTNLGIIMDNFRIT